MHDTPSQPAMPAAQAASPDRPSEVAQLPVDAAHGNAPAALVTPLPEPADTAALEAATAPVDAAGTSPAPEATPVDAATAATTAATTTAAPADANPTAPAAARDMTPAACAALLKQQFPALFGNQAKPMKLRIQADINQRAPGVFSKAALSAFFRRYTGSTGYLMALGKATQRFDLDGAPAGELTEEHRQLARDELSRRREVTREREQQTRVQAQAQFAQERAQAQAKHVELLQARQTRAALLRDFERTTLTLGNFCALKGLTPEALTPLLDQARKEAAEAPVPRPMADRPPHDMRRDMRRDGPRDGPRDGRHDGRHDGPRNAGSAGRPDSPTGRPGPRADGAPDPRRDERNSPRRDGRPPQRGAARPPGGPSGRGPAR